MLKFWSNFCAGLIYLGICSLYFNFIKNILIIMIAKKLFFNFILITGSMLFILSCNSSNGEGYGNGDGNELSWHGVYTGTLPCADCEGIEVLLTLKKDSTFTRILKYLGKDDYLFTEEGTLEWDDESRIVTVAGNNRQMYLLKKDELYHLDAEGEKIKGDLASMYVLDKNMRDSALEDKVWQLKEMNGVTFDPGNMGEDAYIVFYSETSSFSGKNTCNNIFGRYKIKKRGGLEMSRASATRMACPDAPYEQDFMVLLANVEGYSFPAEEMMHLLDEDDSIIATFVLSKRTL